MGVILKDPSESASAPMSVEKSCPLTLYACVGSQGLGLELQLGFLEFPMC